MRPQLSETQIDETAQKRMASYHANVVNDVKQAIQENKIVVIGMAHNPFCRRARKALHERGFEFKYVEHGNYFSKWKPRLAIKLWSGWPTFPQVFIEGKLIGGCTELEKWLQGKSI